MSTLLDRAITEMRRLPPEDQDAIAGLVLDELADESAWQAKFRRDAAKLSRLAAEAWAEEATGTTRPLDPLAD